MVKTLIAAQPALAHAYTSVAHGLSHSNSCKCFELLGFDVFIDHKMKPWLIEVNHSPSFGCDAEIDRDMKFNLIARYCYMYTHAFLANTSSKAKFWL